MFNTMICGAALAFLVLLAPDADAQRWEGLSLKKRLETALAHNPEILLAEAKVRQAEAEYQAMRLKVTKQVLELNASYKGQREIVKMTAMQAEHAKAQVESGRMSSAEWMTLQREYLDAQNQLAQLEAQASYLLGAQRVRGAGVKPKEKSWPARPDVPEKFAGHMKALVEVNLENVPLKNLIASFKAVVDNEQFVKTPMKFVIDRVNLEGEIAELDDIRITLNQGQVALDDALLMIADRTPVRFVFRDYGILVTTESQVHMIFAAAIPSDVPYTKRR